MSVWDKIEITREVVKYEFFKRKKNGCKTLKQDTNHSFLGINAAVGE